MKEDLNRHIPQKINEFASLALTKGTPSLVIVYSIFSGFSWFVMDRIYTNETSRLHVPSTNDIGVIADKQCL